MHIENGVFTTTGIKQFGINYVSLAQRSSNRIIDQENTNVVTTNSTQENDVFASVKINNDMSSDFSTVK